MNLHLAPASAGIRLTKISVAVIEQFEPFEKGVDLAPIARLMWMRKSFEFARSLPVNTHLRKGPGYAKR